MNNRNPFSAFRLISLALLLISLLVTALQLVRFSRIRSNLPSGMRLAGVPVGGLDRAQASQRVLEAYSYPLQLHYGDAVILMAPAAVDFQIDIESMLALADVERTQTLFWQEFWDYLWNRSATPPEIALSSTYSEARLRVYLQDIAARYDQPATPALPLVGTVDFQPGKPGTALDVESAIVLIENALTTLSRVEVDLPVRRTNPTRPAFQNLKILLEQTIKLSGFDGLASVYLLDLRSAEEMHFAYRQEQEISVQPDIAFTASSIIKIPIMVSSYLRISDDADTETLKLLSDMIERSGNEAADWLMDRVIDPARGPLVVTRDMRDLGLENTFLSGYFSVGSPLLAVVNTPANSRTDINTDPDIYSQTTSSDMGMLLEDLYQCAESGGGTLIARFPGALTQTECQLMVQSLLNNRLPSLLTAGIPEGTPIAHKHGWVSYNGVIRTIGDAGIVYSPGGNYILVVFLNHPDQLVWDSASELIAVLSSAVYNFYNLPQ